LPLTCLRMENIYSRKSARIAVMISRFFVCCVAVCVLAAVLLAQSASSTIVQRLLPPDAKIIEIADLHEVAEKQRLFVLWMRNPKQEVRSPDQGYCGDAVYGDNWVGPTRLSLVDPVNQKLLNTIDIMGPAFLRDAADSFRLPFLVGDGYYHVPQMNSNNEGKPTILYLQDLSGDGLAAEFVLFMYGACGIAETGVFGYQKQSDQVVPYLVEVQDGSGQSKTRQWVSQIFARKPIRPGLWDFTWEPGHGADSTIREQVSFDNLRQLFVEEQKITPYPARALPK
jgi:hypothetical protein